MSPHKKPDGYSSFSYLEPEVDYKVFDLADELKRVEPFVVPLTADEEARVKALTESSVFVSLHEHLGVFPDDIAETPEYARHGRMATAGIVNLARRKQTPWPGPGHLDPGFPTLL